MSADSRVGLVQIMTPQAIDVAEQQLAQRLLHDYPHVRIVPPRSEGLGLSEHAYYTIIDATNTINAVSYQFADREFFTTHEELQDARHVTPILTLLQGVTTLETVVSLLKGKKSALLVGTVMDYIRRDILTVNAYGGLEAYSNPHYAEALSADGQLEVAPGENHLGKTYVLDMFKLIREIQETNFLEDADETTRGDLLRRMQVYVEGSILARSSVMRSYFDELLPVRWEQLRRKAKKVPSPFSEKSSQLALLLGDLRNITHDYRTPVTTLKASQQTFRRRLEKNLEDSDQFQTMKRDFLERMYRQWVRLYNMTSDRTDDFLEGRISETVVAFELFNTLFYTMKAEVSQLFGDEQSGEVFIDETEGMIPPSAKTVSIIRDMFMNRIPQNIVTNIWKVAKARQNSLEKVYVGVGGHFEETFDGRVMLVLTFRDNLGGYPLDVIENGWGYHGYGKDADGEEIASTGDGLKGIYEDITTSLHGDFIPTNFGPEEIRVGEVFVRMTGACTRLYLPIR